MVKFQPERGQSRRKRHREFYKRYIRSTKWFKRREAWAAREKEMHGELICYGCGRAWSLKDHLHHANYIRLGDERHEDLWSLCEACHDRIHEITRSSRSWKRLSHYYAQQVALRQLVQENQQTR